MKITQLREIIREEIKSINEGKLDRIGSHLIKDLDKKFKGKKGTTSTFNKIKKELKRKMPGVSDMVAGSIANQYNDFLLDKDLDDKEKIRLMAGTLKRLGMKESVNESVKRQYRDVYSKYYKTYKAFATGVMDLAKSVSKISGDKTDERIILKNFTKQIIPFASLMRSWSKGHEKNPHISEAISKEEWAQYPAYARKLKPYMQKLLKVPLKVRVIKQANHNPWIEVRVAKFGKDVIPNDFRLKAAKAIGATSIRDKSNVNYGNIRSNSVSLKHDQWVKLLGNKVKV